MSSGNPAAAVGTDAAPSWVPYAVPMALFLVLTLAEGYAPKTWYPALYTVKVAAVTVALCLCAKAWRGELRWDARAVGLGLLAGLIGLPLWLGIDAVTPPLKLLGTRSAYDPYTEIVDPALRAGFLAVRLFGLAAVVPVMEEVFWRSFLLRYATDPDRWKALPLGTFSAAAFAIVAVLFALAHPEYLAAFVYAALMAGLLRATGSLSACVAAHAATNLALGVYVLLTGNWKLW
jgi:CAAX prenyl protease-related protein